MNRPHRRSGQGMTEYIIIVALVAIASIAVVTIFGNQIRELFSASTKNLNGQQANPQSQGDSEGAVKKTISQF